MDPVSVVLPVFLCMSGARRKVDLDYNPFHHHGKRVIKNRDQSDNMASTSDLHTDAININTDIEDLFDSYDIGDLCNEDELVVYLGKIEELKKNFRRVYAQIRTAEGDKAFKSTYKNYDKELDFLKQKFIEAKQKLADVRKSAKENIVLQEIDSKRTKAVSEWEFSVDQIYWSLKECSWETVQESEDVQRKLSSFESLLPKLCKVFAEVKSTVSAVELQSLESRNIAAINAVRDHLRHGGERLQAIRSERALAQEDLLENERRRRYDAEQERILQENRAEESKIQNLLACGLTLQSEIKTRFVSLVKKFKVDLSTLTDREVLDIRKREDSLTSELREILDKISSLIQFIAPCGKFGDDLRNDVALMQDDISIQTDEFLRDVQRVIVERDISEEKMKNAAGLNIQIPKFRGYHSEMDIYVLRTEFKKLVEPELQKSLWADYLKKNILAGPALNLVAGMEDVDLIWQQLIEVYGNTQLLLQNKIGSLSKFSNLESSTDDEKIAYMLSSILNVMGELTKLAEDYDLAAELYYGGGLQRVLDLIGRNRERRFIKKTAHEQLKNDQKWVKLVDFLRGELREREAYILNEKSKKPLRKSDSKKDPKNKDDSCDKGDSSGDKGKVSRSFPNGQSLSFQKCICLICEKDEDHVLSYDSNKKPFVDYIACQKFVDMNSKDRDKFLFSKKWCGKCLKPGVKYGSAHDCDTQYTCTQKYKSKKDGNEYQCLKHVLVCPYHCDAPANKQLLEKYRKDIILGHGNYFDFTKKITIGFSEAYGTEDTSESDHISGIFEFQTIDVAPGLEGNVFYDGGCGGMVARKVFIDKLASIGRATLLRPCEVSMEGVNGQTSVAPHGIWKIRLRMKDGRDAVMIGAVVDAITVPFPKYPLKKVEEDIHQIIGLVDIDLLAKLPRLPKDVGGEVDLMFGRDYLKYHPRELTRLESGLTVYESIFFSPGGSLGVVAGPHPEFDRIDRLAHFCIDRKVSFYTDAVLRYLDHVLCRQDSPLVGKEKSFVDSDVFRHFPIFSCTDGLSTNSHSLVPCPEQVPKECVIGDLLAGECGCSKCSVCMSYVARAPKGLKKFEIGETIGTDISYRCVDCRKCAKCLKGSSVEEISLREEYEQSLIDKSVTLDTDKNVCTATLPFIENPESKLGDSSKAARKVYDNVVKILARNPEDKKAVLEAEGKLQHLGFWFHCYIIK